MHDVTPVVGTPLQGPVDIKNSLWRPKNVSIRTGKVFRGHNDAITNCVQLSARVIRPRYCQRRFSLSVRHTWTTPKRFKLSKLVLLVGPLAT